MANYSYLCGANMETTYPSFVDADYASAEQTVACDVYCVPLLWLPLFREKDIVRKTFVVNGDSVITEAPLAPRLTAIEQLSEAQEWINALFRGEGALDEYVALLQQALDSLPYRYLTVEMEEIACLGSSEQEYYDGFRAALAAIGNDRSPATKARFMEIAQFRNLKSFPPARLLLDELGGVDDDYWNFCRLVGAGRYGAGIGRVVPWELG